MNYKFSIVKSIIVLVLIVTKASLEPLRCRLPYTDYEQVAAFCEEFYLHCVYVSRPEGCLQTLSPVLIETLNAYRSSITFTHKCLSFNMPPDMREVRICTDEHNEHRAFLPETMPLKLLFTFLKHIARNAGYELHNQPRCVVNIGKDMYLPNSGNTIVNIYAGAKLGVSTFSEEPRYISVYSDDTFKIHSIITLPEVIRSSQLYRTIKHMLHKKKLFQNCDHLEIRLNGQRIQDHAVYYIPRADISAHIATKHSDASTSIFSS